MVDPVPKVNICENQVKQDNKNTWFVQKKSITFAITLKMLKMHLKICEWSEKKYISTIRTYKYTIYVEISKKNRIKVAEISIKPWFKD